MCSGEVACGASRNVSTGRTITRKAAEPTEFLSAWTTPKLAARGLANRLNDWVGADGWVLPAKCSVSDSSREDDHQFHPFYSPHRYVMDD